MRDSAHDTQVQFLQQMYEDLSKEHNMFDARAVGWVNTAGQYARFKALLEYDSALAPATVLDVGCGYGDLLLYMRNWQRMNMVSYTGIDIVPEFIHAAQERYKYRGTFLNYSAKQFAAERGERSFDLVVGSGTVGWHSDPFNLLTDMWYMADKCLAFNWFSGTSTLTVDQALAFAEMVGCKFWSVKHDYLDNDYTVHMYKDEVTPELETGVKELVNHASA